MPVSKTPLAQDVLGLVGSTVADGTIIWTASSGQIYTTHPGSRLLFPSLCKSTAPISAPAYTPSVDTSRALMMPRRKHTRQYNRQRSIEAERRLNHNHVAEPNKPPAF